jgi:NADH-quinone oxidoreductase subunit L
LSYVFYVVNPSLPGRTATRFRALYNMSFNKWYFDELYERIFVRPSIWLGGQFWRKGDAQIIDGIGPDGVAAGARRVGAILSRAQSGYLYHYAFAMLIGVALLVTYYLLSRGK